MKRDPIQDDLESELRLLRSSDGATWEAQIAARRPLINIIGAGSVKRAVRELAEIRRVHGIDPQSDVAAYFAASGWKTSGDTLEKRLNRYANRVGCVNRTARRRSDRGILQIAKLLRDSLTHERPWARVLINQSGDYLYPFLFFNLRQESLFAEPAVYVNGKRANGLPFKFTNDEEAGRIVCIQDLKPIQLDTSIVPSYRPMAIFSVSWAPQVEPTWDLLARLADDRLFARLSLEPFPRVIASVSWWYNPEDRRPGPLRQIEKYNIEQQ